MNKETDPVRRQRQSAILAKMKAVLEDQVHSLNEDARQLKSIKQQVGSSGGWGQCVWFTRGRGVSLLILHSLSDTTAMPSRLV